MSLLELFTEFWPQLTFLLASAVGLYQWRSNELRHGDVLAWSDRSIDVLQRIYLLMRSDSEDDADCRKTLSSLSVEASILVEQGRLRFKNIKKGSLKRYGSEKPLAYQGIRPTILDWLLCVHEAAARWQTAKQDERKLLLKAVEIAERNFVSLAQSEVGRARTSSKSTREPGEGLPLEKVLAKLRND